jgi:hypothetical protein
MFKKSFADILKENLTDDSFKPPPPPPPSPPSKELEPKKNLLSDITEPFLLEIKKFYITVKDIERIYGSRSFYKSLFKEPIKRIFYWCEEDWQGKLFVIYYYKNKYIYVSGYFGSCEVCDGFPQDEESLQRTFRCINVCNDVNDINIHGYNPEYTHPQLVKDFEKFKFKTMKMKKKITLKPVSETPIKVESTTIQEPVKVELNTVEEPVKPSNKKITDWASLFK